MNKIDVFDYIAVDPDNVLTTGQKANKVGIDTIFVNGVEFKGASGDSQLGYEEFVWATTPTRSYAFDFQNMDSIPVGLVARCQVNFKYFDIQHFMLFREAIKSRHFFVVFFNLDAGKWMKREMYCSDSSRNKIQYFQPKLLGVFDFTVELVATNRDIVDHDPVTITYYKDGVQISSEICDYADEYTVTSTDDAKTKTGYTFVCWNTMADGSGWAYQDGETFTAFKDTKLYAIFKE